MRVATVTGIARRAGYRVLRRFQRAQPAILMYHRIATETFDPWGLAVAPERFEAHLAWLKRNRQVMPLSHFAELHRHGQLPARAIAITFDDGYACNAEVAAPLLATYGVPATIFLPTELVARPEEFWWDDLERIILSHPVNSVEVDLPSGPVRIQVGDQLGSDRVWRPGAPPRTPRQQAFHAIWSMLKDLEPAAQSRALGGLRNGAGTPLAARETHRAMTAEEIGRTRSERIEMGAHSRTHTSLSARDPAEQAVEIGGSRARCAAIVGTPPASFAYPYGDHDAHSIRLAEEAGFLCACTTEARAVTRASSSYALPRIAVGNWSEAGLARALRTA